MTPVLVRISLLALAGAAGTLSRYGVQVALARRGAHSALATGVVNVVGCLLLGLALGALEGRSPVGSDLRIVLLAGFLGAFTTFSTLIGDASVLAREGSAALGVANVLVQVVAGLTLLAIGFAAGRAI